MPSDRSYSVADIRRAIDQENERHKRAIDRLNAVLESFSELADLIPQGTGPTRKPPPTAERIVFDPKEWGGKKRLLLRLIAAETDGLTSSETVAAAQYAGLSEARPETVTPQLSTYKADGLLDITGTNWCITQKGQDFLANKS